ncbi:MAG: T9SS type A sorting domain-containing protein [Candidatus Celaenobacter antarcticus]|nr:T9SS type A sorting domain-containing protein [Candidatus Celaenobacter antarcticus]MDP8315194.1 T9SS type A sorting domain-containing protein [Candidatus Celaenobacter antarcticus]
MKKLYFSLLVLGIIILSFGQIHADNLKVHFIDVRQGDAILIQYGGENYIIDSGKNFSSNKLIHYVDSVGVTTLNACLITHPDYDHYGEFEDLIESELFNIEKFIRNKDISMNVSYIRLMNLLLNENIPVDSVDHNCDLNWTMTTDILSPNYDNGFSGDNNNSIVIKMSLGEVDFLFTGDSVEDNNQYLLDTYDLDAEVLKVSHHGGIDGTSDAFLAEVTPAVSVISSGNNSYGHPTQTVIGLLQDEGSLIYSTADDWNTWWISGGNGSDDVSLDDDVLVETDGENIWVNDELVWSSFAIDEEYEDKDFLIASPNPFKNSVAIQYYVRNNGDVKIHVYDLRGRLVKQLLNEHKNTGSYEVEWNADGMRSGIYFCKFVQGSIEEVMKLVLVQ